jgi:hypothetical protein
MRRCAGAVDLTIWVTPEAIATWTPPASGRRGRPARYSDVAIEAGLMLRLAFGRPWRVPLQSLTADAVSRGIDTVRRLLRTSWR